MYKCCCFTVKSGIIVLTGPVLAAVIDIKVLQRQTIHLVLVNVNNLKNMIEYL
jgi:hypothetical protein